jgi:ABC-type antimicrobial peptide transport system permease subunit
MEILTVFVFLSCLSNLALLIIGRAKREAHNDTIRAALGARLSGAVRLAMLESATLAIFGCIVAVPLSWGAARILSRVIQSVHGFDAFPTVTPSISLLSISIGITLVIACVMSAGANIWFGKRREGISLKEVCSATGTRSRNWIIGFEVFTSVILITVAVVNGIGSLKLDRQPSGFATDNAVMASLDLKAAIHGAPASPGLEEHIVENIEQSPGVQSIASINVLPLSGAEAKGTIRSRIESGMMRQEDIWPADVSLEYFSTIGTAIIKGRDFAREDFAGTPVCIVSNRFASSTFSGDDTLGKYLYEGGDDATNAAPIPYCRIIGVAEDVHFRSMSDSPDTVVYRLSKSLFPNIIVRAVNSGLAIQAVRNAVKSVAPDSLTPRIETIQEHMEDDLRLTRVIALSAAICAFISAIVLSIGFFGILSLQVAEQRRKIGIQIALGANRTQICISVMNKLRQSILAGLAFGSGAALLAATEVAQNYGLGSGNVIGGFLGGLFTLGVLLLASAIAPLRRAFAVSPMECLRSE